VVEGSLPPHVDTVRDRGLLQEIGLDVDELVDDIGPRA
jgi:hypothetical protein